MTDSAEGTTDTTFAPAATPEVADRNTRLYQVLAWVGIVAGVLFIVAVVFFSGVVAGRTTGGYGWHRGAQSGQTQPGGGMGGGCPMMQMQPGGMGQGGMPGGMGQGGMTPGGMKGPTATSMPMPPAAGQR